MTCAVTSTATLKPTCTRLCMSQLVGQRFLSELSLDVATELQWSISWRSQHLLPRAAQCKWLRGRQVWIGSPGRPSGPCAFQGEQTLFWLITFSQRKHPFLGASSRTFPTYIFISDANLLTFLTLDSISAMCRKECSEALEKPSWFISL